MKVINDDLLQHGFTPSEAVLIYGELFSTVPVSKRFRRSLLLDGKTKAGRFALICNYITAAILANAEAGVIELSIVEDANTNTRMLVCYPTAKKAAWPAYTLESRLMLDESISVANVVKNWIIEESYNSFERAEELGKIMLVLREFVVLNFNKWGGRQYVFANDEVKTLATDAATNARTLLTQFEQNCPDKYRLLLEEISAGVQNLIHEKKQGDSFKAPDPWLNELPEDVAKYKDESKNNSKFRYIIGIILWAVLCGCLCLIYKRGDAGTLLYSLYISAAICALILLLNIIAYFKPASKTEKTEHSSTDSAKAFTPFFKAIFNGVILFPILSFFIFALGKAIEESPRLAIFILVIAVVGIISVFHKKIAGAISKKVADQPEVPESNTVAASLKQNPENSQPVNSSSTDAGFVQKGSSVKTEIITVDALPAVSAESQRRVKEASERSPAIKKAFLNRLYFLCISCVMLAGAYCLYEKLKYNSYHSEALLIELVLMVFTLILPKISSDSLLNLLFSNSTKVNITQNENDYKYGSLRPLRLTFAGIFWIMVMLINLRFLYVESQGIERFVFCVLDVAIVAVYIYSIQVKRRLVERSFPYYPPINLLALRVFGSSHLSNFLDLIHDWLYIGTINRLDGFDTAGEKAGDFVNYVKGRVEDSIVKMTRNLKKA